MARLALNKLLTLILVILVILAALYLIFKPQIFDWIKGLPEYQYEHDEEIDMGELTTQQLAYFNCNYPIASIGSKPLGWAYMKNDRDLYVISCDEKECQARKSAALYWEGEDISNLELKLRKEFLGVNWAWQDQIIGSIDDKGIVNIKNEFLGKDFQVELSKVELFETLVNLNGAHLIPGIMLFCKTEEEVAEGTSVLQKTQQILVQPVLRGYTREAGCLISIKRANFGEIAKISGKDFCPLFATKPLQLVFPLFTFGNYEHIDFIWNAKENRAYARRVWLETGLWGGNWKIADKPHGKEFFEQDFGEVKKVYEYLDEEDLPYVKWIMGSSNYPLFVTSIYFTAHSQTAKIVGVDIDIDLAKNLEMTARIRNKIEPYTDWYIDWISPGNIKTQEILYDCNIPNGEEGQCVIIEEKGSIKLCIKDKDKECKKTCFCQWALGDTFTSQIGDQIWQFKILNNALLKRQFGVVEQEKIKELSPLGGWQNVES